MDLTLGCATNQRLVETRVELPLGLVMEEQDGSGIVVCEIAPGSNAGAASPKVRPGLIATAGQREGWRSVTISASSAIKH